VKTVNRPFSGNDGAAVIGRRRSASFVDAGIAERLFP
jgi:hypothetical protein